MRGREDLRLRQSSSPIDHRLNSLLSLRPTDLLLPSVLKSRSRIFPFSGTQFIGDDLSDGLEGNVNIRPSLRDMELNRLRGRRTGYTTRQGGREGGWVLVRSS